MGAVERLKDANNFAQEEETDDKQYEIDGLAKRAKEREARKLKLAEEISSLNASLKKQLKEVETAEREQVGSVLYELHFLLCCQAENEQRLNAIHNQESANSAEQREIKSSASSVIREINFVKDKLKKLDDIRQQRVRVLRSIPGGQDTLSALEVS